MHSNVQGKFSLTHLHHPRQPVVHTHFITARQANPAGGRSIHLTSHTLNSSFRIHPKSAGLGRCGALFRTWLHMCPACYPTRSKCWYKLSCVGGIFSISLCFCVKRVCLALFTFSSEFPRSYSSTTNLSKVDRSSLTSSVVGVCASVGTQSRRDIREHVPSNPRCMFSSSSKTRCGVTPS